MCGYEGQNILLVLEVLVETSSSMLAFTLTHCTSLHNTHTRVSKNARLKNRNIRQQF